MSGLLQYDPDVFDSMAVVNSELWNDGEEEEETGTTLSDLLPDVSTLHTMNNTIYTSGNLFLRKRTGQMQKCVGYNYNYDQ